MLLTKAYYGMASIPCPTFFRITFGLSFDQDTEQALEELQQKFAVLRKTREASAMASATWNGLFPLITLFGFLRNSFANDGKLLLAHHQAMSNKMQVQISQLERQILEEKSKCDELKQKLDRSDFR